MKKILLSTKRIFGTVAVKWVLFFLERVKPYVNAHLHCMVSSLKLANKMSTLPINGKISTNAYACVVYVYNVTSALYCAINNHFCVIRVPFVATSMSLNVLFITNWVCMKTYTHIYVARTCKG